MDEEVGILDDQGLDWTQIDQFDEWLLKDKHYEILIPEKKAIVVFKPRRRNKTYYDAYDRRREEIDELIDWWKYKNKWKRPISKNDELAMKMIEKRLFAKTNRSKWFKLK